MFNHPVEISGFVATGIQILLCFNTPRGMQQTSISGLQSGSEHSLDTIQQQNNTIQQQNHTIVILHRPFLYDNKFHMNTKEHYNETHKPT